MRILINDYEKFKQDYSDIFSSFGYEQNELIFSHGYEATRDFITNQLAEKKHHVDLIITNDGANSEQIFDISNYAELKSV